MSKPIDKQLNPSELRGTRGGKVALAKYFDVSPKTLRRYELAGVDIFDEEAVRLHVSKLVGPKAEAFKDQGPGGDAKDRKTEWECRLLQQKFERQAGDLLPVAKVEEEGIMLGAVSKSLWDRLENDLPPMLEGRTAAEMQKVLRDYARNALVQLSDLQSGIYERCLEK